MLLLFKHLDRLFFFLVSFFTSSENYSFSLMFRVFIDSSFTYYRLHYLLFNLCPIDLNVLLVIPFYSSFNFSRFVYRFSPFGPASTRFSFSTIGFGFFFIYTCGGMDFLEEQFIILCL